MNLQLDTDFVNLNPDERKAFLRFHGITYNELAKKHRRTEASISYAIDGKRDQLLKRIAKPINRKYLKEQREEVKDFIQQ